MGFWDRFFSRPQNINLHKWGNFIDGVPSFNLRVSEIEKLNLALSNPALLKVIALQCDMFSLGDFYVYKDNKEVIDHPLKKLLDKPNPFQTKQEFLWEWMFWQMLGVSHVYSDTDDLDRFLPNKMYNLIPYNIDFPLELIQKGDRLVLSSTEEKNINDTDVRYLFDDGGSIKIPLSKIDTVANLGTPQNRYQYPSRVDALLKVISNNDESLNSTNVNLRYAGKFMVTGKTADVNTLPLTDLEKKDIEDKVDKAFNLLAVKSPVDIKRYVENIGNQKLDDFYLHTYFVIGSMFNIPKDVLEAFNSGTYENQEKARGSHVAYSLQPKAEVLCTKFSNRFKLSEQGLKLYLTWEEQPFMQVFAIQKADAKKKTIETILDMQRAGISDNDINIFLDVNFKYDKAKSNNGQG